MKKQTVRKSLLALMLVLMVSSVSRAFAQTITITTVPPSQPTPADGDPGGGNPDPTGGGNSLTVHLR